jgi:hypothetical protein
VRLPGAKLKTFLLKVGQCYGLGAFIHCPPASRQLTARLFMAGSLASNLESFNPSERSIALGCLPLAISVTPRRSTSGRGLDG